MKYSGPESQIPKVVQCFDPSASVSWSFHEIPVEEIQNGTTVSDS